ncbi:glycosyltransferase family 39 protein [Paraflavisolibacter sp. H34]|uniref:ArnT family glycosyltransferase n=1 Tax=Huijunlia imazamoxiresistens TaxID=3127457 RepID=UPI00301B0733
MNAFVQKHHRTLFYATWFLVGMLQASFSELLDDEAYYWVFSRFLDWGYFDHPPMTALLIRMGTALFPGELGVRLLMVVLNTLTIFLCEKLTDKKDPATFYLVCFSLAVLQIGGFLAVPDNPLMFFTALFFLAYRRFVTTPSVAHTFLMAVVTTFLLYSKYHAALIILFTLLSNLSLLRRWQTYVAGLLALLFYLPHLWWQYGHDWISFRYHLFESNVNPYKVSYTLDYILGQILIAGPLAGVIFWNAVVRYRTLSLTERALKATGIGIFLFFFLSSFRGRVEANWTAPAIIPIIVLSHQYLLQHAKARRWTVRLLAPTLVLVVLLRTVIVFDLVPVKAVAERFHSWKGWPQELFQKTHGLPVVLSSSYQNSSKYWFYSGQPTYSLNEYMRRRNNYNFWPIEDSLFGRPVVVFNAPTPEGPQDSLATPIGTIHYSFDSSFHSFSKVMVRPQEKDYATTGNGEVVLNAATTLPDAYRKYLLEHPQVDFPVKAGLFDKKGWLKDVELPLTLQQLVRQQTVSVRIRPELPEGTYFIRFAIGSDAGWFSHNSDKIKLLIQ